MSNPNATNVYYNGVTENNTDNLSAARIYETRHQNLVDNIYDYFIRVEEAKIPISTVPLFIMEENTYSITINDSRAYLHLPPNTIISGKNNTYIYNIQEFINSVNQAFITANGLALLEFNAPSLFYDYDLERFRLAIDYEYTQNNVTIFMNSKLMYKLAGFDNTFFSFNDPEGKDYRVNYYLLADNYFEPSFTNSINYPSIVMASQTKFAYDLFEVQSIIIISHSLPINKEYIGEGSGLNTTLPILAKIPILFDVEHKSRYLYYKESIPTWHDTNTQGPLNLIDIEINFLTDNFKMYPIYLQPSDRLSVRLQLIKKSFA